MSDEEEAVYELSVNQPNLPKGEPVQIAGLGTFKNGSSYPITKTQAEFYRTFHSTQVPVVDDKDNVVGSEVQLGPTILQDSKNMYGVEVVTAEKSDKDSDADTTKKRQASSDAVTTTDKDTSKTTPNSEGVKLANEKPAPDPNKADAKPTTEGGAS